MSSCSVVRKGPYPIADVPLVFGHGPMKARVVFNHAVIAARAPQFDAMCTPE